MAFQGRRFNRGSRDGPREMHKAVCSECGKDCEVPFKPNPERPVYCKDCWTKKRDEGRGFAPRGDSEEKAEAPKIEGEETVPEVEEPAPEAEEADPEAEESNDEELEE
jgi:CxxC-x17-CxxC domain-containing protein